MIVSWVALAVALVPAVLLVALAATRRLGRPVPVAPAAATRPREPRPSLSEEERRRLQQTWPSVVCAACGTIHPGLCPRVRRVKYNPNGSMAEAWLWPNDEWEPPPGALTADDVFPSGIPVPPEETK